MISQIKLQNFRCFEDTLVDFKDRRGSIRPLNVIYGDNVSGKTSFLMAFAFVKHSVESLHFDKLRQKRTTLRHKHNIDKFVLKDHIVRHYRKGSHSPMVICLDFQSDNVLYRYKMVMIQGQLIEESLYRKARSEFILCFHYTRNELEWGTRIILSKDRKKIDELFKKYHSKYTILSILNYVNENKLENNIRVHDSIKIFLNQVSALYIEVDRYYSQKASSSFLYDHDLCPFEGYLTYNKDSAMKKSLPVVNNLLSMLFPELHEISYKTTTVAKNYYKYELVINFKNTDGFYTIPNDDVPKSLFDFLSIMAIVLGTQKEYIYIIDNFANNISYFSLKQLFESIIPIVDASCIFTMGDNDAMNLLNPRDIQISWIKEGQYHIDQLSSFLNAQQNHNLRSRFEKGLLVPIERLPQIELGKNVSRYLNKVNV